MIYTVKLEKQARHTLAKLQPKLRARILEKIRHIAADPYAQHIQATKLQGKDGYRLRIGDWRVLYRLEDEALLLIALDIKHRGAAYKH